MKSQTILMMGIAAIAGYWIMNRLSGNSQTTESGMYWRQIVTMGGDTVQLNQKDGVIYDQYGGQWT